MTTQLTYPGRTRARYEFAPRRAEKVLLAYFAYTAVTLSAYRANMRYSLLAWCILAALTIAIAAECRFSTAWSRVLRDWLGLGLILLAYRQADWLAIHSPIQPPVRRWEDIWVAWDHLLLEQTHIRLLFGSLSGSLNEWLGAFVPSLLELTYLSLYALPAACLGLLYWYGKRDRIDRFLTMLFLGTFCAYALLPFFPSTSPRIAFPDQDIPNITTIWRTVNVWLLDKWDISSSVFPSGHVAVAFSCAFGILRALPEKRGAFLSVLTIAATIFTATVYCRYHYFVDGLASLIISATAWLALTAIDRDA